MNRYELIRNRLKNYPKTWLITGVAGFIGSNLLEELLLLNQKVVGLDNFSTGYKHNLTEVESIVLPEQWGRFSFIEGDICDYDMCLKSMKFGGISVDYVLHQAALGSVPRSIENPLLTNAVNVTGFLNMLTAAQKTNVSSFTYAASSSTYGDHPALPKVEHTIGNPLSPYAVTKYVNELYASVFASTYDFKATGLRYFNVFGKRQNINGAYAAVIPKWVSSMIRHEELIINGDGQTSRDFCFVDNAVQMNILAATASSGVRGEVYNVAVGDRTSLQDLFNAIKKVLIKNDVKVSIKPIYKDFRYGDVRHSQADISKAEHNLGYFPKYKIIEGLGETMPWYVNFVNILSK